MAELLIQTSSGTEMVSGSKQEERVSGLNQTGMVTGSNMFVLHGYTAAKSIGVRKYIASDEFTVGGYNWAIHVYPNGEFPEDNSIYVSASIALAPESQGRDVQVMFELTLIDQSGKGNHKVLSCFDSPVPRTIRKMCGYKHLIRKATLETSDYLRDDCLKIYCTIGVVVSAIECSRLGSIQGPDCVQEMVEILNMTPKQTSTTLSCSLTETMSGSNLFMLHGYSMAKGMGSGRHIASNEFSVGGYKWAIFFYPDGRSLEDNLEYASVFIALVSEGRDVPALFELTLMDQSGKGKHQVYSCFDKALPRLLKTRGSMWGCKKFFRRDGLEMSDYIRDDCLKIYCTVGVVSAIDCSRFSSIQVPDSDIGSHIGMLQHNVESCDITFNVSGEKLHAHKLILAVRSPKLGCKLLEGVDSKEVMVPDVEPEVFKALLHFIYTDCLKENELIASAPLVAYTITAKLLAAADHYGLERLKRLCESHLCKYITVDSVIQVMALADRYHAAELKGVCLKFAAQNSTAVMRGDGSEYHEKNWPTLQFELSSSVGGCDEDRSNGGGTGGNIGSVSAQVSDGGDISGRRVRRRLEDEKQPAAAEL